MNKSEPELARQANALLQVGRDWLTQQFRAMGKAEEAAELAVQLLSQLQGAAVLTQVLKAPNLFTRQVADAKTWLDTLA